VRNANGQVIDKHGWVGYDGVHDEESLGGEMRSDVSQAAQLLVLGSQVEDRVEVQKDRVDSTAAC
jgi:hypothetical protein